MARIRTVKPEFYADQKAGSICRDARLAFIGIWTEADDEGRLVDSPKLLAGSLFPWDEDVTAEVFDCWLKEMEGQEFIVRYSVETLRFIQVVAWNHQRIDRPSVSRIPCIPRDTLDKLSPNVRRKLAAGTRKGKGARSKGAGSDGAPIPADFGLTDDMRKWATEHSPLVNVTTETKRFVAYWTGEGKLKRSWPQTWRTWMLKEQGYGEQRQKPANRSAATLDRTFG